MGRSNYDPEIETAAVPLVTGFVVVILDLLNLIPEYTVCERCTKKSFITRGHCRACEDNK